MWAARSKYGPANTFLRCIGPILTGLGLADWGLRHRYGSERRDAASDGRRRRRRAVRAGDAPPREQIAERDPATELAARDPQFIVFSQGEQQEPRVFEGNAGRNMQFEVGLVGDAQHRAGLQRAQPIARLDAEEGAAQQAVDEKQARELRGLKMQIGVSKKIRGLARRFTAVPRYAARAFGPD